MREFRNQAIQLEDGLRPFKEVDYRAMRLILDRCEASPLKRRMLLKKLEKDWRAGRLVSGRQPTQNRKMDCEARLMLGHFTDWDGWQYRDPWAAGLWHNPEIMGMKPWNGLRTGHLYIMGEQGVGDEVFFAQALPACLALADKVTFEGDPRLIPALKRMGVHEVISSDYVWDGFVKSRKMLKFEADAWMASGDLPRVLCRLKDVRPPFAVNYIQPDPEQVKKYERYKGRVGISWRGAQGHYKAGEFQKLAGDKALSLQYDQSPLEKVEKPEGLDLREDFEGVLGLLANLEKIITVSTTVAHLAFASGVAGDLILAPKNGRHQNILNWKYGLNRKTPWYPSANVYQALSEYG